MKQFNIIMKHKEDDYEITTIELPENIFDKYINNGYSVRGSKQDIIEEINNI